FRRTTSHRFVRKNADPKFAFALHIARQRNARRFDLRVRDPRALERLQTEFAEIDSYVARRSSLAAPALGLAILHSFGHQRHGDFLLLKSGARRLGLRLFGRGLGLFTY